MSASLLPLLASPPAIVDCFFDSHSAFALNLVASREGGMKAHKRGLHAAPPQNPYGFAGQGTRPRDSRESRASTTQSSGTGPFILAPATLRRRGYPAVSFLAITRAVIHVAGPHGIQSDGKTS